MKPAIKRTVNKSVERTQRNKEKEKEKEKGFPRNFLFLEFEVFLGGANKERVQEKRILQGDKKIPPREMKKWENPKQKKQVSEPPEEDLPLEDIEDDTDIIQELQSLGQQELELLKKSIYQQPILSVSQLNVLKKLSEGNPIDEKFNPHFSRLSDDITQEDVFTKHIPEEEVDQFQKIIVKTDNSYEDDYLVEEKINEEPIQEVVVKKKQPTPQQPPAKPQRKTVQAQKVVQSVKQTSETSNSKNRPISAMQLAKEPQPSPFNSTPTLQQQPPPNNQKRINTNPFQNSRPKSVVQNPQVIQNSEVSIAPKTLEQLISRIQNMDENAQIRLIKLLDSIENGENPVEQKKEPKKQTQPLSLELPKDSFVTSSTSSQQFKIGQNDSQFHKCTQIVVQLLTTWGSSTMIGLTEIQVFDMSGQLIKLQPGALVVRGAQSIKPIDILANGNAQTTNAASMWLASMPNENTVIEIELRVLPEPRQIKIWNYNKSLIDSSKGVKDILIRVTRPDGLGREIKAQVNRGTGHDMEDFGTIIEILDPDQARQEPDQLKQEPDQPKQEQPERLPSRKQRGPVVYNIFNEDDLSRQGTGKRELIQSPNNQNNQIFQSQNNLQKQEPGVVGRIRGQAQQSTPQVDDEDLMKTLKNFALNNPGRFHENQIEENKKPQKINEYDALDMFFKEQREIKAQPKVQQQQQVIQQEVQQRTRQTEKNTQLINQIIQENNALIRDQTQKSTISIPTLPAARYITIKIHSTWGDRHYVGLNGIEFWDEKGQIIELPMAKRQIKADPSDINVLSDQGGDPRTPDKLIDGVYLTQSDMHVWLAPFNKINYIYIDFLEKKKISMIRIWNYNKSRTHSFRGAKEISINLDKQLVFKGIVRKAPGNLSFQEAQNEQLYELINFTDDTNILNTIATQDWINQASVDQTNTSIIERPPTSSNSQVFQQNELQRPTTSAKVGNLLKEVKQARQVENQTPKTKQQINITNGNIINCRTLTIQIHSTWQTIDCTYVGLTGLQVYDQQGTIIKIQNSQIQGQLAITNLLIDKNITTQENFMWLIPFTVSKQPTITISFTNQQNISAIKIWNYNKSKDSSYRGAKIISIKADQNIIASKILLKRAPGVDTYDFGQVITFSKNDNQQPIQEKQVTRPPLQDYDTLQLPSGFDLRFDLIDTYGDINYIGLNGIEVFDSQGNPLIKVRQPSIAAKPNSVNVIPSMSQDPRVVQNLIQDQPHDTFNDNLMWLAPFVNRFLDANDPLQQHEKINQIWLGFDRSIVIGAIQIWNYSKTPERGTRELSIWLDDAIIYKGYLRISQNQNEYKEGTNLNSTVIIFNKTNELCEKFGSLTYHELDRQQKVNLTNEKKGIQQQKSYAILDRPITSAKTVKK